MADTDRSIDTRKPATVTARLYMDLTRWAIMVAVFGLIAYGIIRVCQNLVGAVEMRENLDRGQLLEERGATQAAAAAYHKALEFAPDSYAIHVRLADLEVRLGRPAQAAQHAKRAAESADDGDRVPALLAHGSLLLTMGAFEDAKAVFRQALLYDHRTAEGHCGMARAARALNDYPTMVSELEQCAAMGTEASTPEFEQAYAARASRISALTERAEQNPHDTAAWYALGHAHLSHAQWPDAVRAFERAVALSSPPPDAYFWLGVAAEVRGDRETAGDHYGRALAGAPGHLEASRALQRVAQ